LGVNNNKGVSILSLDYLSRCKPNRPGSFQSRLWSRDPWKVTDGSSMNTAFRNAPLISKPDRDNQQP
jgi:hypothetical protein